MSQPKKIDELLRRFLHTSGVKEASRIAEFRKAFDAALLRLRRLLGETPVAVLDGGKLALAEHAVWSDVGAFLEALPRRRNWDRQIDPPPV